jgi:signal transduction histidine kinase
MPRFVAESLTQNGLAVRRDGSSVVAVFAGGKICEATLPPGDGVIPEDAWECGTPLEGETFTDLLETPEGRLSLASVGSGVFEQTESGWRRLPGELAEMHAVLGLEPSPSGGTWVIGWRDRWRVEEDVSGGTPVVVERLGTAHGIPNWQNGSQRLEETDGTIWVPLYSGLVRVPAEARLQADAAPSVTLTSLIADGRQVASTEPLELRHGGHSLEIRWSALSFRDPSRVRYRMRLDADPEWSVLNQPFLRLAGLGSGSHRVELGASLDGQTWSDRPAVVEFDVREALYLQAWFVVMMIALVLAVLYVAYRVRLAHLLRLERQRTRIAMDLHDEMGAGLGSAGLLVGLLGELDLDEEERQRIGERATEQIRDLGDSLSDIVWSLRPGTETLDVLLLFLRQRAADLFPAGGGTRVTVDAPEPCPELPLNLAQRRNLQWIAVEALHNAARHAGASRVIVKLSPAGGEVWTLSVRDDGKGLSDQDSRGDDPTSGLGSESMQRRANEIGAKLSVRSAPGEGTEVSVRFRPGRR